MATEGLIQLPPDSTGKTLRTVTGGKLSPAPTTHQHVYTLADPEGFLAHVSADGKLLVDVGESLDTQTLILRELRRIALVLQAMSGVEISDADLDD